MERSNKSALWAAVVGLAVVAADAWGVTARRGLTLATSDVTAEAIGANVAPAVP